MPSLIRTFEYDIFISYRHNDNLDGWVTDFVQNLERELRGTLKESVTIYFDKNQHDGLLETHNVDKSLEGKLKCLIFIPIISQTYCDTKSFAWQNEFVAFNKMAIEAAPFSSGEGKGMRSFGRDIKLSNGNVASRILPVKIHDLDMEDKTLLESELGGVLRAIEFIYKEAGVNRPLKSTDNKNENQNKTDYRNQVNKVANAIKEIITSLKNPGAQPARAGTNHQPTAKAKRKPLIAILSLIFLTIAGVFLYPKIRKETLPITLEKSIAVLPFTDMSQNKDQEFFSDGLTEDIITQLAKIKAFKVTSRTSVMQYKRNPKPLKEIGNELGASFILEGSVQRSGNQVRINAQLIESSTDEHLWAESYDRSIEDIFAIQSDIANQIANALQAKLSTDEQQQIEKKYTKNTEAYQLCLMGRYYWNQRLEGPVKKGIEYFKQAIEKDPTYALAYLGLGDSYLMLGVHGFMKPEDCFPRAKGYAEKALQLDQSLAEAYATLIDINTHYYWDFEAAEKFFQKAIEADPFCVHAYHWHAEVLIADKQFEKAFEESQVALTYEPYSLIINSQLGKHYIYAGHYDKAIRQLRKVIDFDSTFAIAHRELGIAYLAMKDYNNALSHLRKANNFATEKANILAALGYAEAKAGKREVALRIEQELLQMAKVRYVPADDLAVISLGLEKKDQALQYLDLAIRDRCPWMPFLGMDPIFNSLKENSKFQALLQKVSVPKN